MKLQRQTAIQLAALGLLSLIFQTLQGRLSLWQYPGTDMFPWFQRASDPGFAPGDFYCACSSHNPRVIFGSLVMGLAGLLHTDWMHALYLMKSVFVVFLPPAYFLVLLRLGVRGGLWKDEASAPRWALFLLVLGFSQLNRLNMYASVGLWAPFYTLAHPQTLSLLLGLAALLPGTTALALPLFAASAFVHPALGLFVMAFGLCLEGFAFKRWAAIFGIGFLLPAAILARLYPSPAGLSAADFVQIYSFDFHPMHYVPTQLLTNTRFPWWLHLIASLLALGVPGLIARRQGKTALSAASLRCTAAYALSVLASYAGLELMHLKAVSVLGPMRFTQFGAWMGMALWAGLIDIKPRAATAGISAAAPAAALALAAACLALLSFQDPIQALYREHSRLYDWMKGSTSPDAVFASPPELRATALIVGRRPQLMGDFFAFREDCFVEFKQRMKALYGLRDEWPIAAAAYPGEDVGGAIYDHRRTASDFVAMSKTWRLDYVIRHKARPGDSFNHFKPRFDDGELLVYAVADLGPKR